MAQDEGFTDGKYLCVGGVFLGLAERRNGGIADFFPERTRALGGDSNSAKRERSHASEITTTLAKEPL